MEKIRQLLTDPDIDFNQEDNSRRSPFYIACKEGHIDIVKLLLCESRINPTKLCRSYTPFEAAQVNGQTDIILLLKSDGRFE